MTAQNYRFGYRYFIARKRKHARTQGIKSFLKALLVFAVMFILAGLNNT